VAATVLIVDDHPPFRAIARAVLEAEGYTVVGEAANGREALAAAERLRPALVLLDVQLPDADGRDLVRRLPATRVVLVSGRERSSFGRRLTLSGAIGFLAKDELSGPAFRALAEDGAA
jgi:DNA-binding NarL/FixJ family response regulator